VAGCIFHCHLCPYRKFDQFLKIEAVLLEDPPGPPDSFGTSASVMPTPFVNVFLFGSDNSITQLGPKRLSRTVARLLVAAVDGLAGKYSLIKNHKYRNFKKFSSCRISSRILIWKRETIFNQCFRLKSNSVLHEWDLAQQNTRLRPQYLRDLSIVEKVWTSYVK